MTGCEKCGKPLPTKKHKAFCSNACYRPSIAKRPCEQCGKEFKPLSNNYAGRFCCRDCYSKAKSEKGVKERNCECCGKSFKPAMNDTAKNPNKYCSSECYWRAKTKPLVKETCLCCGVAIEFRAYKPKKFCSHECFVNHRIAA
jgi:hypothetical protein